MKKTTSTLLGVLLLSLNPSTVFSQVISKVKDQKALLDLQGAPAQEGEEFFSLDSQGKKKSILKIKQIKGDKAVADVLKGKPEVGQTLQSRTGGSASADTAGASSTETSSATGKRKTGRTWGVLGGFAQDKMDASFSYLTTNYTANMTGNGFALTGFYDMPMSKDFILRGSAGLEQFVGAADMGVKVCDSGTSATCNVNIMYLSFYGQAKYNIISGRAKFWVAGGLGYLFAASKSSNVLKTDGLSTYVIVPSIGADIPMGGGFLPLAFDYIMFPDSTTVKANAMALRAGWGWYF